MSLQKYRLDLTVESYEEDLLTEGATIIVPENHDSKQELILRIIKLEKLKGGFDWVIRDFNKLVKALSLPFSNKTSRAKLVTLVFVYVLLSIPKISIFFIRGWRLGVISRMINPNPNVAIVPSVNTLNELGENIRQGVRLIGARAAYKLPELIILAAIGYDHLEMIIDWIYFFFGRLFGEAQSANVGDFVSNSFSDLSVTLFIQLLFFVFLSVIITPAYRIMVIKYANGNMEYNRFFNLAEIRDSFRLYKKYVKRTFGAYFWDIIVSGVSLFVGFVMFLIFPYAYFILMPFYKLAFKHWPKSYGYGLLGRRLKANGEI